jgi:predicted flap endonuclease-1-like 5' DNA nuclease
MGYLLTEIVVYLVIAGLIGFAFGWLVRDGALNKYFDKLIGFIKKIWEAIKSFFGKIKAYCSSIEIFKKSSETKEPTKSDTEDKEKFCLITKVKELWNTYYLTLTTSKKVVKETKEEVKETAPEKVAEVSKEEPKVEEVKTEEPIQEVAKEVEPEVVVPVETEEVIDDASKPTLFTETPTDGADKLSALKGIGPVLEKKLNELGVYTYAQIASWDSEQEVWIGTQMAFPKRVTKEEWVKQAKELLKNK